MAEGGHVRKTVDGDKPRKIFPCVNHPDHVAVIICTEEYCKKGVRFPTFCKNCAKEHPQNHRKIPLIELKTIPQETVKEYISDLDRCTMKLGEERNECEAKLESIQKKKIDMRQKLKERHGLLEKYLCEARDRVLTRIDEISDVNDLICKSHTQNFENVCSEFNDKYQNHQRQLAIAKSLGNKELIKKMESTVLLPPMIPENPSLLPTTFSEDDIKLELLKIVANSFNIEDILNSEQDLESADVQTQEPAKSKPLKTAMAEEKQLAQRQKKLTVEEAQKILRDSISTTTSVIELAKGNEKAVDLCFLRGMIAPETVDMNGTDSEESTSDEEAPDLEAMKYVHNPCEELD